jgi:hypothetical protein
MRTMIATMLLPLLALVGVEVFTRTSNVAATPIAARQPNPPSACRIDGTGRLRVTDGDGERTLAEAQHFELAKNSGLTAYAAMLPTGLELLVCSEMGNVLHRVAITGSEVQSATAVTKVRLLTATRAFVELHVNPSTDLGLLLDLRTGDRKAFEGHHFALSPDGRDVAYFREPAHGSPAGTAERAAVYVNARELADVPRDSGLSLRWQTPRTLTATVRSWNGAEESCDLKPF